MPSTLGILDLPALVKVSWDITAQYSAAAKDAPYEFQDLVNELGSLHGILKTLSDGIGSGIGSFKQINDDRKIMLESCVNSCFKSLQLLKNDLDHYRELGIGDRKSFWRRNKWAKQRTLIESMHSLVIEEELALSVFITATQNDCLARIQRTIAQARDGRALSTLDAPFDHDSEPVFSPLRTRSALALHHELIGEPISPEAIRPRFSSPARFGRGSSLPRYKFSSSDSVVSGSEVSISGGTAQASTRSVSATRSPSRSAIGRISHLRGRSGWSAHESSIDGRQLEKAAWEDGSDIRGRRSDEKSSQSSRNESRNPSTTETAASAMQELRQVRLEDQLSRPVRYEPQNKLHKPDPDIVKIFNSSVKEELQLRKLTCSIGDWLRISTWWLLKARATLANCNRHYHVSARGSSTLSSDSKMTSQQAYIDLLKASYILYDIVLEDEGSPALSTDENRKLITDLSESINEELAQYASIEIPEASILQSQNLDLWEPLQPEEIAVDQDDAGDEMEKVLYRTFVNAGIGSKKFRMRTKGAPYMLLLTTRDGESEPKIVLCNQSGSLCLQRDFLPDDLQPLIQLSNATLTGFPKTRASEPVAFEFGSMRVSISFQFDADIGNFINIPKAYFDAVWQREPIDSKDFTETVIFKSSVEIFEQLKTPNMQPLSPPLTVKSCDVRILERSYGEAWRSIRRIVISSSAAETTPRCIEFFMPLSRVQVYRVDVSRQVLLKWSDTSQERSDKTDGNYNALHSYVYDERAPNIGIGLYFCTPHGAVDFERAVLEMNFRPDFAWSQLSSSGCVYDVVDTGTDHKQYKAVVLFQNPSSRWRYSNIAYLYRDADYAYEHSSLKVRFPGIYHVDYISTHVDQLYHADSPVGFSHCEKKPREVCIEFNDESVPQAFLSALSPLYELLYSRRIQSLSSKSKLPFGSKKSGKGGAELQIWSRGSSFQLAARWDDSIPNKWFTMAIPSDFSDTSKEALRLEFPRLPYSRGTNLDLMNIMARSPKTSNLSVREGPISILFQAARDREEFLVILRGRPLSTFM